MTESKIDGSVIYDFGANIGATLPYYFHKANRVIAVEANPLLCDRLEKKYAREIGLGRLHVVRAAITNDQGREEGAQVKFWLHKKHNVLSQFQRPELEKLQQFESIDVQARTAASIVEEFGSPVYIKVDVEGYDAEILKNLFQHSITPQYLSAEAHTPHVFELMREEGYEGFKLMLGKMISVEYGATVYRDAEGQMRTHRFTNSSAGPYGEDVKGDWMSAKKFEPLLLSKRAKWKDVHAVLIKP